MRKLPLLLCVIGPLLAVGSSRTAVAEPGCGSPISSDFTLSHDIGPCSSGGLTITENGVTLNLNGYKIFGTASTGDGFGVAFDFRVRVTVKNGTVAAFDRGIDVANSSATKIKGMRLLGNNGPGLSVDSSTDTLVKGCRIEHNAGATFGDDVNDVIVSSKIRYNSGTGVSLSGGSGAIISGNLIESNAFGGVFATTHTGPRVIANRLNGNGFGYTDAAISFVNVTNAVVASNVLKDNAHSGIALGPSATTNKLHDNVGARNAVLGAGFDFEDENADCDSNVWRRNRGTKSQSCIH